jgi:hypothetical protein
VPMPFRSIHKNQESFELNGLNVVFEFEYAVSYFIKWEHI